MVSRSVCVRGILFSNTGSVYGLPILISIASIWGIVRIILANYEMIRYAGQYVSMNTTLGLLLKICIYILILYQTYVLNNKRKNAIEISEQQI